MTRDEWNALVARYTAALTLRVNVHDPALLPARDLAVADALLGVLEGERRIMTPEQKRKLDEVLADVDRCMAHLERTRHLYHGDQTLANIDLHMGTKPAGPPNTVKRECDEPEPNLRGRWKWPLWMGRNGPAPGNRPSPPPPPPRKP